MNKPTGHGPGHQAATAAPAAGELQARPARPSGNPHGRPGDGDGPDAIVLIGCGARKAPLPATAAVLYTGPYFRSCLAAAVAMVPRGRVLVLSARYGLLGLDDGPLAPYELTLGQPGTVTAEDVRRQACARGIADNPVVALCGARYAALAKQVWAEVATPLAGLSIGQQRHVLGMLSAAGPADPDDSTHGGAGR